MANKKTNDPIKENGNLNEGKTIPLIKPKEKFEKKGLTIPLPDPKTENDAQTDANPVKESEK